MNELNPCPFCGNEDIYIGISNTTNHAVIECECGLIIEVDIDYYIDETDYEEQAYEQCIDVWNKRSEW